MCDIYEVMDRWGAWAATDRGVVDWQPIAAGFEKLLPHGKKSLLQCDDDEGILLDGYVTRQNDHCSLCYWHLLTYYC